VQFAGAFKCDLSGVTGEAIQPWLDRLGVGPQSRVNYRRVLSAFFGFCIRRGHVPKGWDELDRLAKIKVKRTGGVAVFTAAELGKLLANAPEDFRPCLALQAFCGLRSSEVERLRRDDVHFAEGEAMVRREAREARGHRGAEGCMISFYQMSFIKKDACSRGNCVKAWSPASSGNNETKSER
jgi:integrase